jgi:hypothetical protein
LIFVAMMGSGLAQKLSNSSGIVVTAALPDAPAPQQTTQQFGSTARQMALPAIPPPRKYAEVIEPGQTPYRFTSTDKLIFSFTEIARPLTLVPALYSASYEQLFLTDPKYGHDSGAFGEKLGAAMLRKASVKVFSDAVFASAFHQDPRYYRVAEGSIIHRGLLSARQALIRRSDDGEDQINFSGLAGRAAAAALTATYYPEPSVTGKVVAFTFWTSVATDAGGNLVVEFLPSVVRRFPIMRKLWLE